MPSSTELAGSHRDLHDAALHIVFPPKLPQAADEADREREVDSAICSLAAACARRYSDRLSSEGLPGAEFWIRMAMMIETLGGLVRLPLNALELKKTLHDMKPRDVVSLYIHSQNAAVIVRKDTAHTLFEVFEAAAPTADVMGTTGKLVRSFPARVVKVPREHADDPNFLDEVASFLAQMDSESLEKAEAKTTKAGSTVTEVRDSPHPMYISELFVGILRGLGEEADTPRVRKRIADDVLWDSAYKPWRRSPVWLILRVALQTSVPHQVDYKAFMVFFHSSLVRQLADAGLRSDFIFAARAKMARRLHKVRDLTVPDFIIPLAHDSALVAEGVIQRRWSAAQDAQKVTPRWAPEELDFEGDTALSLKNSRDYLFGLLRCDEDTTSPPPFSPSDPRRLHSSDMETYSDGRLDKAVQECGSVALVDFESAVSSWLSSWTEARMNAENERTQACKTLLSCLEQYARTARAAYNVDPLDKSIAVLTALNLWMAIDRLAVEQIPLLAEYSPEIPADFMEPLLLRSRANIARAAEVEMHLGQRHTDASPGASVFADSHDSSSFASRYFADSTTMQQLKHDIEVDAQAQRDAKLLELRQLNARHAELLREAFRLEHQRHWNDCRRRFDCDYNCQKCRLQNEAKAMKINVHEWPLPSSLYEARAATFELLCPIVFGIWRSATYLIVSDIGLPGRASSDGEHEGTLEDNPDLQDHAAFHATSRISFSSTTKSFLRAHYSHHKLPASEADVSVNHGMQYHLWDGTTQTWASGPFTDSNVRTHGTLVIPKDSPYRYLQPALSGVGHTTNSIIANQADTPAAFTVHEHLAFGSLRSGPRLQWMNMLRELVSSVLNLRKEEVSLLFTQSAWQIGPLSDRSQEWHLELEDEFFGKRLVVQCTSILVSIQANWMELATVETIVFLVLRLLVASHDTELHNSAYAFLRQARGVSLAWINLIKARLQESDDEEKNSKYQALLCEIAAVCRLTYDVDPQHLSGVLDSPADVSACIQCAIVLYENRPPSLDNTAQHLRFVFCRDLRVAHKIEPRLYSIIVKTNPEGIYDAIRTAWPSYRPGTAWFSFGTGRWLYAHTAADDWGPAQQLHYNLLEGKFLVNGRLLGRLPREITSHEMYKRLFCDRILDVVPARAPGMQYASRPLIHGHQVSLALYGGVLRVQARYNRRTFELVPHKRLEDDFPRQLVEDYVHWLDLDSGALEFRPLQDHWRVPAHWRFSLRPMQDTPIQMSKEFTPDVVHLVDYRSATFQMVSAHLEKMERPHYMIITYNRPLRQIRVDMPRFRLQFFLPRGHHNLESENMRGMIVDDLQSVGALIGLRNMLVLRAKGDMYRTLPKSRSVLIPRGHVNFQLDETADHPTVSIDIDCGKRLHYHKYDVDEDLGRLVPSQAGLGGRLYLAYLHAVTSSCLVDPLTGRTGTEQALEELTAGATQSFQHLEKRDLQVLSAIGALTPQRDFYPSHLQCMQTVHWAPLSWFSQHEAFSSVISAVLGHAQALTVFPDLRSGIASLDTARRELQREPTLLRRASCRSMVHYPQDLAHGNEELIKTLSSGRDSELPARDVGRYRSDSEVAAAWASGLVRTVNGGATLFPLWERIYNTYATTEIPGPSSMSLGYTSSWLKQEPSSWLSLYDSCRTAPSAGSCQYALLFSLSSLSYGSPVMREWVPILLASALEPQCQSLDPPRSVVYKLCDGLEASRGRVKDIVGEAVVSLSQSPARELDRHAGESEYAYQQRQVDFHQDEVQRLSGVFVEEFMFHGENWDRVQRNVSSSETGSWFDVSSCVSCVQDYYQSCAQNRALKQHLDRVQAVLGSHSPQTSARVPQLEGHRTATPQLIVLLRDAGQPLPSLRDALRKLETPFPSGFDSLQGADDLHTYVNLNSRPVASPDTTRLVELIQKFRSTSDDMMRVRYAQDLEDSQQTLEKVDAVTEPTRTLPEDIQDSLSRFRDGRRASWRDKLACLQRSLQSPSMALTDVVLRISGLSSRADFRDLLGCLTLPRRRDCGDIARSGIVALARAFMNFQHSQRLLRYALDSRVEDFAKEYANYADAPSTEDCDYILLQIDGDYRVRPTQARVAQEMSLSTLDHNMVLQLNMGEGKTSVIVPMLSTSLSDGSSVARVIVLRPLSAQMFKLLVERLGGLVNRQVFYLPFSRQLQVTSESLATVTGLFQKCVREGGVLLAQPEHILSLKLLTVDSRLSASVQDPQALQIARGLETIQTLVHDSTHDVLDESDELLHVQYQLVYTSGNQRPLDDHPDRWTTTQQLLALVPKHIEAFKSSRPGEVEFHSNDHGRFPAVRILDVPHSTVPQDLKVALASDVLDGAVANLNLTHVASAEQRRMLLNFLVDRDVDGDTTNAVQSICSGTWKAVLLVRGLLAFDVVTHVLRDKRFRVNYGLDLRRSLLAVPYTAKDVPSSRAEYSHPDVAVALSVLSWLYTGLTADQLRSCFDALFQIDNPELEFTTWTRVDPKLDVSLRKLSGINTKDVLEFNDRIVPAFASNQAVIFFWLSKHVFPKAAKEFPFKLAASGCDLAETKKYPTTGFSGTRDRALLYPTSIRQEDPIRQSGTNALVLNYLLQSENNAYRCMSVDGDDASAPISCEGLLRLVLEESPQITVLLDVGAQMLDLLNEDVARCWLIDLKPKGISAAVFFNDRDELSVLALDGTMESLDSSPFKQQLDRCVVYLDDAHTRGTDLKFPPGTRAAVTLGPNVTKDRVAQGCMRMRQLGRPGGHSVMFFAPLECDRRIRFFMASSDKPQTEDVLLWILNKTCEDNSRWLSHWCSQGVEYARRSLAEWRYRMGGSRDVTILQQGWRAIEAKTLQDMYGSRQVTDDLMKLASNIPAMRGQLEALGITSLEDPRTDEEQEREVRHEVERESQVERPEKASPRDHSLHADVQGFAEHGSVPEASRAFLPMMHAVPLDAADNDLWSRSLLVTADFTRTVSGVSGAELSSYMRPVHWLAFGRTHDGSTALVALSPFEVDALLPVIRRTRAISLHVYSARVIQSMQPLSNLQFYSIPSPPVPSRTPPIATQSQLELFAGSLYLHDYPTYLELCAFLGVYTRESASLYEDRELRRGSDGFIPPEARRDIGALRLTLHAFGGRSFQSSPVQALKQLVSLRRQGIDFLRTHVGQILHGRHLTQDDFRVH